MSIQHILYYGCDRKTRRECMDLMLYTNRKHAFILNLWFMLLMALLWFFSHNRIFFVAKESELMNLSFFCVSVGYFFCNLLFSSFVKKHSMLMTHLCMTMLMVFSILSSTYQPYMAGSVILVMVVLLAISFMDTMLAMAGFLTLYVAVFIYSSWLVKPMNIWYQDVYNVLIFYSLALVLHFSFQKTRMAQFVTYLENIQIQKDLEVRSSFDALTQLLNRSRFFSMASEVLRNPHQEFLAFCIIDLDNFKQINDMLGHQMGDKAIQITGQKILRILGIDQKEKWSFQERAIREKSTLAGRLGGDEFVALLRGCSDCAEAADLMQQLLSSLNEVKIGDLKGIQASIGIVPVNAEDTDIDRLYNLADGVLYASKKEGKNRVTFAENPAPTKEVGL